MIYDQHQEIKNRIKMYDLLAEKVPLQKFDPLNGVKYLAKLDQQEIYFYVPNIGNKQRFSDTVPAKKLIKYLQKYSAV